MIGIATVVLFTAPNPNPLYTMPQPKSRFNCPLVDGLLVEPFALCPNCF